MRVGRWVLPSFYFCQVGLPNCWRPIFLFCQNYIDAKLVCQTVGVALSIIETGETQNLNMNFFLYEQFQRINQIQCLLKVSGSSNTGDTEWCQFFSNQSINQSITVLSPGLPKERQLRAAYGTNAPKRAVDVHVVQVSKPPWRAQALKVLL
jgi:hypothetical protein